MISLGEFSLFFADTIKMCPLIEMLMSFISVGGVGRMLKTRMFKSFVNLVILVVHLNLSLATKCRLNQVTVIQNQSEYCLDCAKCPKGTGVYPQCGSFLKRNVTVGCKACVEGVSYSDSHDHTSCKSCRICVENEEQIKNCTPTSDAQCGECKPGYYRSFVYSCFKCSPCCQDTQEHDVEPQCLKQGLPRDRACRYTGRNCGGLKPTLLKTVFKATPAQKLQKFHIPLPYIVGGIVLMFATVVLAILTTYLLYRVYCKVKHGKPRTALQQDGQYNSSEAIYFSSQVDLGTPLVDQTKL